MFGLKNREQNLPLSSDSSHNILSLLSPSSVNIQLSSCQAAKKRRYDDISAGEGIGGPFDIKVMLFYFNKTTLWLSDIFLATHVKFIKSVPEIST